VLLHTWLPGVLRAAGVVVDETPGWTSRSHGSLPAQVKVVWHHDASPEGDSPGTLNWMIDNWDNSSANIWVDRDGVWHLVGTGVSWHAGDVLPGMPGNFDSIGIETDHTVNEDWPVEMASVRVGTAAIFEYQNVPAAWLHFHKTICDPPGRKVDPDGLDLGTERNNVAAIMSGDNSTGDDNDMADITDAQMDKIAQKVIDKLAARKVRMNSIDETTGKETASDRLYFDGIGAIGTNSARAAYRSR
jgi:hypothetical protein